jgi:signal transduction histidine kinase
MPQFRAKARAVDLLGKGQIADLPTAISELWKNGYDAYGDKLECHLYMPGYLNHPQSTFVLSDDGKGMSKEEIVDKWFVLGTDTKSRRTADQKGEETLYKEPRIKMGEKGIGRLAVAYLGPQMLMLTKKQNNRLEAVFFDWRILENFDLFLEDINIPNKTIASVSEVPAIFEQLKADFLSNFSKRHSGSYDPWKDQSSLKEAIINDCKNLSLPKYLIDDQIQPFFLDDQSSHSTKFLIFQPDEQIIDLVADSKSANDTTDNFSVKYTISTLAALFNLFKTETPEHQTSFWIITNEGKYDLLKSKAFFTPTDFETCDHLIEGDFNEYGEFNGTVRIYNKTVQHHFKPLRKRAISNYGPLSLKLGYVPGVKNQSIANDEQWRMFDEKLEFFSGLYIYRDGFRVLPYGRVDNDFLEFEERRGKHAGEFFFAKRRMFGYIEITKEANYRLSDKSSREGFVNNIAYRDFKLNIIAFFVDLAKKYFSTNAEFDYKDQQKKELEELAQAEIEEKRREVEDRKRFVKQLREFPQALDALETDFSNLIEKLTQLEHQSDAAYETLKSTLNQVEELKVKFEGFNLSKPTRFKPTSNHEKNYTVYKKQYKNLLGKIQNSEQLFEAARGKLNVQEVFKQFQDKFKLYSNTLSNQFVEFSERLTKLNAKLMSELAIEKDNFLSNFDQTYHSVVPNPADAQDISRSSKILENVFNDTRRKIRERIEPYFTHLDRISFDVNEDNLVGYYKLQFEEMKEEWGKTYELAQLGIAVEIIDHQFNTLYSQLSESIRSLKEDIHGDEKSKIKYNQLVNAFHHLEDNYKLLKPLYRTTGRVRKEVSGTELFEYALDFFGSKLSESDIKFSITDKGGKWSVLAFESIFKPVIVNLINNAIYWLQASSLKQIVIDADNEKLIIKNSGAPIEDHKLTSIFKLFYSDRPTGRGIGLYLAKHSLNGIGYDIYSTNEEKYNTLNGACFIIQPKSKL